METAVLLGKLENGSIYDTIHKAGEEVLGKHYLLGIRSSSISTSKKDDSNTGVFVESSFHKGRGGGKDAHGCSFLIRQDSSFDPEECSELALKCFRNFNPADIRTYDFSLSNVAEPGAFSRSDIFNVNSRIRKRFFGSYKQFNRAFRQLGYFKNEKLAEILDILEIPHKGLKEDGCVRERKKQTKTLMTIEKLVQAHKFGLEQGFDQIASSIWSYPFGERKEEEVMNIYETRRVVENLHTMLDFVGRLTVVKSHKFNSAKENIGWMQRFISETLGIDLTNFDWKVKRTVRESEKEKDRDYSLFD